MLGRKSQFREHILWAMTSALGIYLGMFFSFALQQVLNAYETSVMLTEHSAVYGLTGAFDNLIRECSLLSYKVLALSLVGIICLVVLLVALRQTLIATNDKLSISIMIVSIFAWLIAPMAVTTMAIQNPLLYITVETEISESASALFSENFRTLDHFRYFAKAFIYEIKVLIVVLVIYMLSIYSKQRKIGKRLRKTIYASIIARTIIPVFIYIILERLFPTPRGVTYSLEKVGLGFGGEGVIGGEVVIEPFLSVNRALILLSMISLIFILVKYYRQEDSSARPYII